MNTVFIKTMEGDLSMAFRKTDEGIAVYSNDQETSDDWSKQLQRVLSKFTGGYENFSLKRIGKMGFSYNGVTGSDMEQEDFDKAVKNLVKATKLAIPEPK